MTQTLKLIAELMKVVDMQITYTRENDLWMIDTRDEVGLRTRYAHPTLEGALAGTRKSLSHITDLKSLLEPLPPAGDALKG